ncbi:unnamed protein product [Chrysoparadoxa australica]
MLKRVKTLVREACDAALRSRDGTLPAKPDKEQRRHQRSELDKALGRIEWGLHEHKPYELSEEKSKEGWVNAEVLKPLKLALGQQHQLLCKDASTTTPCKFALRSDGCLTFALERLRSMVGDVAGAGHRKVIRRHIEGATHDPLGVIGGDPGSDTAMTLYTTTHVVEFGKGAGPDMKALAKKEQRMQGDQAIFQRMLVKASGDERKTLKPWTPSLAGTTFQRASKKHQIKKLHVTIRRGTQDEAGPSGLVVLGEPGRWDKHLCLKGLIGECERTCARNQTGSCPTLIRQHEAFTTQTCGLCGLTGSPKLGDKAVYCRDCSSWQQRDPAAARNILLKGLIKARNMVEADVVIAADNTTSSIEAYAGALRQLRRKG